MDVVSQVLSVRSRDLGGLERMVGASVLVHVALVAVVLIVPSSWLGEHEAEPETIMTISLAGVEGPSTGMTMIGARPIQTLTETTKAIEPVRPPAAQAPEMIEPTKAAPKKTEKPVEKAAKDPKSRTPTKGAEVRSGTAVAETAAKRGDGFGVSTGGIGDTGSYLDTANFCCPEYLATMSDLIRKNWDYHQQAVGTTVVKFTIERSGRIINVSVEKSSGYPALDLLAQRALLYTRQLPPLPTAFTEPSLPVHLVFEYQRQ